jgi:hypothetical protein
MKRSAQVVLLLMGATSVGASAYTMLPPRGCVAPDKPAAVAPGAISPQTLTQGSETEGKAALVQQQPCHPGRRSTWTRRSYWSSRSYDYSSTNPPTARRSIFSPSRSHTSVPSVGTRSGSGSRSGFGSTGHSVGAHASS